MADKRILYSVLEKPIRPSLRIFGFGNRNENCFLDSFLDGNGNKTKEKIMNSAFGKDNIALDPYDLMVFDFNVVNLNADNVKSAKDLSAEYLNIINIVRTASDSLFSNYLGRELYISLLGEYEIVKKIIKDYEKLPLINPVYNHLETILRINDYHEINAGRRASL